MQRGYDAQAYVLIQKENCEIMGESDISIIQIRYYALIKTTEFGTRFVQLHISTTELVTSNHRRTT
jgi:hypothetical protein